MASPPSQRLTDYALQVPHRPRIVTASRLSDIADQANTGLVSLTRVQAHSDCMVICLTTDSSHRRYRWVSKTGIIASRGGLCHHQTGYGSGRSVVAYRDLVSGVS